MEQIGDGVIPRRIITQADHSEQIGGRVTSHPPVDEMIASLTVPPTVDEPTLWNLKKRKLRPVGVLARCMHADDVTHPDVSRNSHRRATACAPSQ